jgi:hypothetical protein
LDTVKGRKRIAAAVSAVDKIQIFEIGLGLCTGGPALECPSGAMIQIKKIAVGRKTHRIKESIN